ncbi:hypothetical protein Tco_0478314 [Tanacetum coccineum]
MITESLGYVVLARESSQLQSSYEATATLIEFELMKILIDKMDKSESYLAAPEYRDCYEGLKKSYELDKTFFSTYAKVYSLKRSRKDKDKDEDPFAGSDRGLKKRKTNKDIESAKGPKTKESQSGSSKGDKSQSKSLGKSISEEPEFEVADSDMLQDQEENPEPTDPDWNIGKTPQQEQSQSWLMTLASSAKKPSKTFDEMLSTPIDFSAFIMNGLKINNLTQETLLGPTFLLKLPMINIRYEESHIGENNVKVMRKHGYGYLEEIVVRRTDNDLYRFKEGDFLRLCINDIEDMLLLFIQNRLTNLSGDDVYDFTIALRMFTRSLVIQKRVKDLQLGVESYQKKINVTMPQTTRSDIKKRDPYTPYQDPQGFIYVDNNGRNRLMRSNELYKFNDRTLTGL